MRLPTNKEQFEKIVSGERSIAYYPAEIEFYCEELKQQCYRKINRIDILSGKGPMRVAFHFERSVPEPTAEEDIKEFM